MSVKILSWNIWIDSHFDQIKDFLSKSDADIIGLQEVRDDDPIRETTKYLNSLGFNHVFAPILKTWGGKGWKDGPAIFTKHKIVSSQKFVLSKEDPRVVVQADIQIKDEILHVFSTHLTHTHQKDSEVQFEQVEELLSYIPKVRSIVMGDFNAIPESKTIVKVKEVLIDVDLNNEPTWSVYPEGCITCKPQKIDTRLDYIFITKDMKSHSYKVKESKGSDHLPVSVTVELL